MHNTAIYTLNPRTHQEGARSITASPALQRILYEAPQVAGSSDPEAVRVGHSPTGRITVIVLHGPDWSLVLSGGRPVPDTLLVLQDNCRLDELYADGDPRPWSMRDPGWLTEIAHMVQAIHTDCCVERWHDRGRLER